MQCSVPHLVWLHKDIQSSELNRSTLDKKVLVAARSSEFKLAIVEKIKEDFQDKPVFMKFIGLGEIE